MDTLALMTDGGDYVVSHAINVNNFGDETILGVNTANTAEYRGDISLQKSAILFAAEGGAATLNGVVSGSGGIRKTGAGAVKVARDAVLHLGFAGTDVVGSFYVNGVNQGSGHLPQPNRTDL